MIAMISVVIGVFAAVLGGAIALGLLSLLPESWQRVRSPLSIVAAIVIGFAASQIKLPTREETLNPAERLIAGSDIRSLANALRQNDPAAYAAVLSGAAALAQRGGDETALARMRAALVSRAREKYVLLEDDFHRERQILTSDELLRLAETEPSLCWPIVHGRVTEILGFPLGPDLMAREMSSLERALSANPSISPAAPLDPETFQTTMSGIYEHLRVFVGEDGIALLQSSPSASEEQRYCEIAAQYYRMLAEAPQLARLLATAESRAQ